MGKQNVFEITLEFEQNILKEIQRVAILRIPITKQAPIYIIYAEIDQALSLEIMDKIASNIGITFNLKIYFCDDSKSTDNQSDLLFSKHLLCLSFRPVTPEQNIPRIIVEIVLSHPILHFMSTTNIFNEILEEVTAYEALKQFEKFITGKYGDIFDYKHINATDVQNNHVYEQIMIKTPNDLNVPTYLIESFKVNNCFSFYFFDDFYIAEDSKKDVTCHYINISKKEGFRRIDIFNQIDSTSAKIINEKPFFDRFRKLDKVGHTFINNMPDLYNSQDKVTNSMLSKKNPPTISEVQLTDDRKITIIKDNTIQKENIDQSLTFSSITIPDNSDASNERFKTSMNLLTYYIQRLSQFDIYMCLPDFPQFGKIYNLGRDEKSAYIYTPINIVNIFSKRRPKERFFSHAAKTLMIRYVPDTK